MRWNTISFVTIWCIGLFTTSFSDANQAYVKKFSTYTYWLKNIPISTNPEFLAFIESSSPLTQTLREKWLYQLAQHQDWQNFDVYYHHFEKTHAIQSIELQCQAQIAALHQGKRDEAIKNARELWLYGHSRPKACDQLFAMMINQNVFSEQLIKDRIALALNEKEYTLAHALIKQLHPSQHEAIQTLNSILENPKHIKALKPGPLSGVFYLTGLKRLISRHMDMAIQMSQTPLANHLMSASEKQNFIAEIALYKAMRSDSDAIDWINRVQANALTPKLREWRIREAIAHQRWDRIIKFIESTPLENEPCWQYWLARAYEATGKKDQAIQQYESLGQKRHYYGFLANTRLHRSLQFEQESTPPQMTKLDDYQSILNDIQQQFIHGNTWQASSMLNAFSSELPKDEQSALAYWVQNQLHWQGKAILLSHSDTLSNELALRFPLAYRTAISKFAAQYHIEEAFIYAIIRQESLFFEKIVSQAGAKGLMQIMPKTAKLVTKQARIAYQDPKELFDGEKNIHIGTAYMQQLAHQFKFHPILMTAAYNAGPKQAKYWQQHHIPQEMDQWIETLPWQETRNYLKNVIAFYAVYQYRLHQKPNLKPFLKPLVTG